VLLRLSHDGCCESVYLKYLLARDPFCHAPLPDVVLDFCTGGLARVAKYVDTFCNRGHRCGSSARLLRSLLVRRPPVRGGVLAVSVCVFFPVAAL
jgi:hypothetical protein